jgi:hypothetical protein
VAAKHGLIHNPSACNTLRQCNYFRRPVPATRDSRRLGVDDAGLVLFYTPVAAGSTGPPGLLPPALPMPGLYCLHAGCRRLCQRAVDKVGRPPRGRNDRVPRPCYGRQKRGPRDVPESAHVFLA